MMLPNILPLLLVFKKRIEIFSAKNTEYNGGMNNLKTGGDIQRILLNKPVSNEKPIVYCTKYLRQNFKFVVIQKKWKLRLQIFGPDIENRKISILNFSDTLKSKIVRLNSQIF